MAANTWLDCSWYLTLQSGDAEAELNHPGALAELLMRKGVDHEVACLAEFEDQGLSVYRTPDRGEDEPFDRWVARVGDPMADGWDVIYQFPMVHDGMRGIADFLVRVPRPTDGYAVYEPYDAKLARAQAKPGHVLQLCFYADALEELTGRLPQQAHLWLGSGLVESLTVEQFGPYWRRLRRRLREVMASPHDESAVRPEPCSHCEFCEYSQHCENGWRAADSLVFVAGIRKRELDACQADGVATLSVLATADQPIPGVGATRQDRLRDQAGLQLLTRDHPDLPPAFLPVPAGDDPVSDLRQ